MAHFNILYLSSEIHPFAKVGGLADVAAALPKALKEREQDIRVLIPKYKIIKDRKFNLREVIRLREIQVPLGDETISVSVKSGFVPDSKVQAYFLEYKPLFDRKDVYVDPNTGEGFEDNDVRFATFARTAFEMLKVLYWQPDIIHINDWTSALVPYYLKTVYKDDPFFENVRTVLTLHNVAYQGEFDADTASRIGANTIPFDESHPAWHHGRFNFLKAGIMTADYITTVSPTYAQQILTPEHGCGLEDILNSRRDSFSGVINGIDAFEWNPEKDKDIESNYSIEEPDGKKANREALCTELELECDENTMLIGMISRLAGQKGFDLLEKAADKIAELPVKLVILGTGQEDIENMLRGLAEKYPDKFILRLEFDDALAHRIEAGSDAFLMPSSFEPCGMNQMYSQRYGTPPIVHGTGGLLDTVVDLNANGADGTGFIFHEYSVDSLIEAINRALKLFADKEKWHELSLRDMEQDYSWNASAEKFEEVYACATEGVEIS